MTTSRMEQHFIIHTEHGQYRILANPDGAALDGSEGIYFQYRNGPTSGWDKHTMFVEQEAIDGIIKALTFFKTKDKVTYVSV